MREFDERMARKVHKHRGGPGTRICLTDKNQKHGAGNAYLYWEDLGKGTEKKVKLKRRASLQQMSWESFVAALKENKPAILFSWSNKYEHGKGRLITGADDFHFVLSSLCVHTLEECFYESELSGACLEPGDATANLLRFQKLLRNGAVFLGADYVDYNIHESPEHQESVARAIVNVVRHYHQDADDVVIFALMAEWWIESFLNQYRSSDMLKLVQGLGSGVRTTDLFNSLYNIALFEICLELLRIAGINVVVLLRTHKGDDTNAMLSRVLDAVTLYYG
eukprot:508584-Amphidinium_carterae.1